MDDTNSSSTVFGRISPGPSSFSWHSFSSSGIGLSKDTLMGTALVATAGPNTWRDIDVSGKTTKDVIREKDWIDASLFCLWLYVETHWL